MDLNILLLTSRASEVEDSMIKDNNESALIVDSSKKNSNKLLNCVRCGNCKALCPTYIEDSSEGMSARGRIALIEKFFGDELKFSKNLDDKIFSCILCGSCNKLCPLGINVTDTIYEARNQIKDFNKKRKFLGLGIRLGLKKASNSFRVLKFLDTMNELIPVFRIYPFNIIKKMDIILPDSMLKEKGTIFRASKPKGRIAVFVGCSVNFLYPNIGKSLIEILNIMNYDVILPTGEACCGSPLMGLGFKEDAAEMAERNIKAFKKLNVEAVIGLCPTCIDFIKNGYKELFGDAINNAIEVSQFFSELQPSALSPKPQKVIYHDPCHSIYRLNVSAEPRKILQSIGFNIIDSERGCCGFGGIFRLLYQKLSEDILEKRVEEYKKADMIVTSCPNCILQLKSRINYKPIKHIAEIINEYIKIKTPN